MGTSLANLKGRAEVHLTLADQGPDFEDGQRDVGVDLHQCWKGGADTPCEADGFEVTEVLVFLGIQEW